MPIPTRSAGLQRLDAFLPAAGESYARRRNYDHGAGNHEHVSGLSPWLRHRLILEAEVLDAVLARHGAESVSKFIDEVFWRTYFRGWMAHRPTVWPRYQDEVERARERAAGNSGLAAAIADAEAGRTGNEAFDHWARELVDTGYLHNHARMWFASIWVFTFGLPWALGADFFLRHLLDGDPASNTLGWRWVSGLHTRGKTYLARRDNILKYTNGRLDPGPDLAQRAEALEEAEPPGEAGLDLPPEPPPGATGTASSPEDGWLLTEEDCRGQDGEAPLDGPVAGLLTTDGRSPARVADPVCAFGRGAVEDALERSGADGPVFHADATDELLSWAADTGLRRLHVMHAPYGPVADALATIEPRLEDAGVTLQPHLRGYDRRAWPFANRGFFKLRKRIPGLLDAMAA